MKTKFFLILIATLFTLGLTSCDSGTDDGSSSNPFDDNGGGGDGDGDNGGGGGDDQVNQGTIVCDPDEPLVFQATVRDFIRGPEGHVDFNTNVTQESPDKGIVNATLGNDGKPVYGNPTGHTTSNAANFNQWYNDVPGINETFRERNITLTRDPETDNWVFDDDRYFPLGVDEGFGSNPNDMDLSGNVRNFGFTTEFRMTFRYKPGQVFTFRGDDDVFVFIDKKLVIDLGGIHSPQVGSVDLDTLGLTSDEEYAMDIFHAERNPTGSNFRIETNIECIQPTVIE